MLLEEPLVERVEGRLRPGVARGETLLVMEVEERFPLEVDVGVANDRPPSVGSATGYLGFIHHSVNRLTIPLEEI